MDVIKARAPVVNNEVKIPNIPDIQKIISSNDNFYYLGWNFLTV
jgi:hypothetical protein